MTGGDLINSALRLIGVLASGEVPASSESADAFTVLNQRMDGFNADRLAIFTDVRQVFVPASLKQTYTLGTGGDFNIARPPKVTGISVLNLANASQPLELPLDYFNESARWAREVPVKNLNSALPKICWDDCAFPSRNLNLWPIPNVQVNFAIYFWQALSQFADFTTDYTFPPAYLRMLRYNLAVDLAAEFGGDPSKMPLILKIAQDSLADVKAMNVQPLTIGVDDALVANEGEWNWLTGEYSR